MDYGAILATVPQQPPTLTGILSPVPFQCTFPSETLQTHLRSGHSQNWPRWLCNRQITWEKSELAGVKEGFLRRDWEYFVMERQTS